MGSTVMADTAAIKVYSYSRCSTCKKALAFLRESGVTADVRDISTDPPSTAELRAMIRAKGGIRALFNTSGRSYREGGFAESVGMMSIDQAVAALAADGMLIKRPFVLTEGQALLGFKPEEWNEILKERNSR